MEIEEAFSQEAIAELGDGRDDEIRAVVQEIYKVNELELTRDHENVAVLCFMAGRIFQADEEEQSTFLMPMDQVMMAEFIGFLVEKRGAGA